MQVQNHCTGMYIQSITVTGTDRGTSSVRERFWNWTGLPVDGGAPEEMRYGKS